MDSNELQAALDRVQQMEKIFDELRTLWEAHDSTILEEPHFREQLKVLTEYYESPLWRQDYELDEQGKLPADLKRGVLSQDGIYNFLSVFAQDVEIAEENAPTNHYEQNHLFA